MILSLLDCFLDWFLKVDGNRGHLGVLFAVNSCVEAYNNISSEGSKGDGETVCVELET